MKTLQSDLQGTLERLRADTADWKPDMVKRDNRLIISVLGIMVAGITILGFTLPSIPAP